MIDRRQKILLAVAAALGVILAVWMATRPVSVREQPELPVSEPAVSPPESSLAEPVTSGQETAAEAESAKSSTVIAEQADEKAVDDSRHEQIALEVDDRLPEAPEPSWEFTPEELAAEAHEFVSVSLGSYQVRVGDEFEVEVTMNGPPLQAMVLALAFDRTKIEPVPDSGAAVGSVFREGVELFIHPTDGRATLFCASKPGKKNVLAARGDVVAVFRMRAKAPGRTSVAADDRGLKFVGGSGIEIRSGFIAAEVTVLR